MEKELTGAELERVYKDSNSCDDNIFSEMRSNILLVSGEHYNKKGSHLWNRVRNSKGLDEKQKIRLTKNHVKTLCNRQVGRILAQAPSTKIVPNNEDEIQDQKTAELNNSVWDYQKKKMKFRKKVRKFANDFIQMGECYCKIFFDPNKGDIVGYEPKMEENEDGEECHCVDEQGNLLPDEDSPVMSGDFVFERVLPFNLLRDPNSQTLEDSPYLIIRKMMSKEEVKAMIDPEDGDKMKALSDTDEETYLIFDGDRGTYDKDNKKIMVREHYYRPCYNKPNGYFYICVEGIVLADGELPFGVWPIAGAGFDEIVTSARHHSPIKQMRPYQVEINRSASKQAETQITLGDDKLILKNGAKMSHGGSLAGLRAVTVTGSGEPTIMSGRSGEQYGPYNKDQITELYNVMEEQEYTGEEGQFDPYAMLYFSARNRKKFKPYVEEFEEFLQDVTQIFIDLAKEYLDETAVIPMIGKSEQVNIPEFKHSENTRHRVQLESVSDDIDSMYGKQLAINHTLQYVGKTLDKNDIGRMMSAMPYMNYDEAFGDMSIDYNMSKNDLLALERGEQPFVQKYDNHKYLIGQATNRIKKPDFRFLAPEIQQLYQVYLQQHEQAEAEAMLAAQRLSSGFIPVEGALLAADYYTRYTKEDGTVSTKRAKIPQRALEWLEQQLEAQGTSLQKIEEMNQGAVQDIGEQVQGMQQQPQMPQQM